MLTQVACGLAGAQASPNGASSGAASHSSGLTHSGGTTQSDHTGGAGASECMLCNNCKGVHACRWAAVHVADTARLLALCWCKLEIPRERMC